MASVKNNMFAEECMKALAHLLYSDEIKLYVINGQTSVGDWEALGGTRQIYYEIKEIIDPIAINILRNSD